MPAKTLRIRVFVLLLGILFLGAQFHFCADLTSDPTGSHICPFCSAAGTAITAHSPSVAIVPVTDRFEGFALISIVSSGIPRATSPRAPPSL